MKTQRRNMVRDAVLRDDQAAHVERLAGRDNRPMAEVIRCLIDIGLFVLTGDVDRLEPKLAGVVSLPDERERRRRMQATCGHSIIAAGKCSWCGKPELDVAGDELGEPA
jgi:hypothetical protein